MIKEEEKVQTTETAQASSGGTGNPSSPKESAVKDVNNTSANTLPQDPRTQDLGSKEDELSAKSGAVEISGKVQPSSAVKEVTNPAASSDIVQSQDEGTRKPDLKAGQAGKSDPQENSVKGGAGDKRLNREVDRKHYRDCTGTGPFEDYDYILRTTRFNVYTPAAGMDFINFSERVRLQVESVAEKWNTSDIRFNRGRIPVKYRMETCPSRDYTCASKFDGNVLVNVGHVGKHKFLEIIEYVDVIPLCVAANNTQLRVRFETVSSYHAERYGNSKTADFTDFGVMIIVLDRTKSFLEDSPFKDIPRLNVADILGIPEKNRIHKLQITPLGLKNGKKWVFFDNTESAISLRSLLVNRVKPSEENEKPEFNFTPIHTDKDGKFEKFRLSLNLRKEFGIRDCADAENWFITDEILADWTILIQDQSSGGPVELGRWIERGPKVQRYLQVFKEQDVTFDLSLRRDHSALGDPTELRKLIIKMIYGETLPDNFYSGAGQTCSIPTREVPYNVAIRNEGARYFYKPNAESYWYCDVTWISDDIHEILNRINNSEPDKEGIKTFKINDSVKFGSAVIEGLEIQWNTKTQTTVKVTFDKLVYNGEILFYTKDDPNFWFNLPAWRRSGKARTRVTSTCVAYPLLDVGATNCFVNKPNTPILQLRNVSDMDKRFDKPLLYAKPDFVNSRAYEEED